MRLMRFVGNDGNYEFPPQVSGRTNFMNLVPRTVRRPGTDGGYSEFNGRRAPQSIGNVAADFWLLPEAPENITDLKDAVSQVAAWGEQYLFILPEKATDLNRDVRWCRATLNNLGMSENVRDMPHIRQRVSTDWQVPNPVWQGCVYSANDMAYNAGGWYYLDDGLVFDTAGLTLGGPRVSQQVVDGERVTVTNSGSHPTYPVLRITAQNPGWIIGNDIILSESDTVTLDGSGLPLRQFGIRRLKGVSETVIESWIWTDELLPDEVLVVDCEKQTVIHETSAGDVNGYPQWSPQRGFGFIEIPPGTHVLEVFGDFDGDARLDVEFFDAWY